MLKGFNHLGMHIQIFCVQKLTLYLQDREELIRLEMDTKSTNSSPDLRVFITLILMISLI